MHEGMRGPLEKEKKKEKEREKRKEKRNRGGQPLELESSTVANFEN